MISVVNLNLVFDGRQIAREHIMLNMSHGIKGGGRRLAAGVLSPAHMARPALGHQGCEAQEVA